MGKDTFKKYEDMLSQDFVFGSGTYGNFHENDMIEDDGEDFITSKEIVKMHKEGDITDDTLKDIVSGPVEIEEDVYFKRYTEEHEHKYTETELAAMREGCKRTIVHDYSENDRYHISDEERAKNDSLAELSAKLGGLKRLYRKVDQYIYAMRVVVEAWEILEKKENFIHDSDEFYRMVAEGKIYHSGIMMPKLKGMDKYNIDMLIKYISNPELDPADLLTKEDMKKRDPFYDDWGDEDDETEEEEMERLMSPEEIQFILDYEDNPPEMKVHDVKHKYIKGYDCKGFASRRKKKFSKKERMYVNSLHEMLNKIQSNPANRSDGNTYGRSWLVTNSMFEQPEEEKDFWDDLYFDGSWTSKDDLFLYDMAVNEAIANEKPRGEAYMTNGDKDLQKFFRIMEDNGMNVIELRRRMNMSETNMKLEENKKNRKENKKIESALIQRITKLNKNEKFKKLVAKAEKSINDNLELY